MENAPDPAFKFGEKVFYKTDFGIEFGSITQRNFDFDDESWHYQIKDEDYPEYLIAVAPPNLVDLATLKSDVLEYRYNQLMKMR